MLINLKNKVPLLTPSLIVTTGTHEEWRRSRPPPCLAHSEQQSLIPRWDGKEGLGWRPGEEAVCTPQFHGATFLWWKAKEGGPRQNNPEAPAKLLESSPCTRRGLWELVPEESGKIMLPSKGAGGIGRSGGKRPGPQVEYCVVRERKRGRSGR
jgi:hypothetical protein